MNVLGRIKQLRDERGWSNYRLAKESNLSENVISNIFRRNNVPTIPTLEAICRGLGITLSQFFSEGNDIIELNEEQKELFKIWCNLTQKQKNALLYLMKQM